MNNIQSNTKTLQKLLIENRIRILNELIHGETCVCELVEILDIKHNLLSHHLNTLNDLGFAKSNRQGRHIKYSIPEKKKLCVQKILDLARIDLC